MRPMNHHRTRPKTPCQKYSVGNVTVVGNFMQLIVLILVDVYMASVLTTVRIKTLPDLLKVINYLEAEEIKRILMVSAVYSTHVL